MTYREATAPTCAACGARLHRAQTYYDGDGLGICPTCFQRGNVEEARARVAGEREEPVVRGRRAYVLARVIVGLLLMLAALLISTWSRR